MTHRTLLTAAGHVVTHTHDVDGFTPAQKQAMQAYYLSQYPGIQPVVYVHLDGTHEELLPTHLYNCWDFTFNPRQCWLGPSTAVQTILDDNGVQVFPPNLRLGDVICYRDEGVIMHTGRIVALDAAGEPSLVQSKWGPQGEYLHRPEVAPASYGTDRTYWRVTPLSGKGDAWLADNPADDRLPYPAGTLCASPDLWVNNHGGTYHEDPMGGQPNCIFVRVRNPDTLPIAGARVHIYWCDPTTGFDHQGWHEIGTALVDVAPGSEQIAGPVNWTPDATVPDHACLFAIVDTGDDPRAATTLDPIVWPFDSIFDNNIVWHNLTVHWLHKKSAEPVELWWLAHNPLPLVLPLQLTGVIRQIGPAQVRALNLDPRLAEKVARPPQAPGRRVGIAAAPEIKASGWEQSGNLTWKRGWRAVAGRVRPGDGAEIRLRLYPNAFTRPRQAYHVYVQQSVGGRITGAISFVVIAPE